MTGPLLSDGFEREAARLVIAVHLLNGLVANSHLTKNDNIALVNAAINMADTLLAKLAPIPAPPPTQL